MLWFRGANKMRNEGIRLGEQRSQVLADVIDRINKTSERWNNRLTIENTRFIDRYEGGELQILIEFSVGSSLNSMSLSFKGHRISGTPNIHGFDFADCGNNSGYTVGRCTPRWAAATTIGRRCLSIMLRLCKRQRTSPLPPAYGSIALIAFIPHWHNPFIFPSPSDLYFAGVSAIGK